MSDDLIDRLRGLNLTAAQRGKILDYALKGRPDDDDLEAEALAEIPVPNIKGDKEELTYLLEALDDLGIKKSPALDAIIAEHYGVRIPVQSADLVPYSRLYGKNQHSPEDFLEKAELYQRFKRSGDGHNHLKKLAKMGVVDRLPVRNFLACKKGLDNILGGICLDTDSHYNNRVKNASLLTVTPLYLGSIVLSVLSGNESTFFPGILVSSLVGYAAGKFVPEPSKDKHQNYLLKHVKKCGASLESNLQLAKLISDELLQQARYPSTVSSRYVNRLNEVEICRTNTVRYLNSFSELIRTLK